MRKFLREFGQAIWKAKPHILVFLVASLLIYCGFLNMHEGTISSAMTVTQIDQMDGDRAEIIKLRHMYTPISNTIDISFKLGKGNSAGTVFLAFQDDVIVDSAYFNKDIKSDPITVHQAPFQDNWVYVEYSAAAGGSFDNIVKVSLPAQENRVLGMYIFEIPQITYMTNDQSIISYEFYAPTGASVSIAGSLGQPTEGKANGYKWDNLRKIDYGTTVTVSTPELARSAQISLAFGAILIALGVNIFTTHIYELIKYKLTKQHQ